MSWIIKITNKAAKQVEKLPKSVKATVLFLLRDIERNGPSTGGGWKNYGKLNVMAGDKRHCHLMKGNPTYVCCWEVVDKQIKLIEVYYVGTHEKAPY